MIRCASSCPKSVGCHRGAGLMIGDDDEYDAAMGMSGVLWRLMMARMTAAIGADRAAGMVLRDSPSGLWASPFMSCWQVRCKAAGGVGCVCVCVEGRGGREREGGRGRGVGVGCGSVTLELGRVTHAAGSVSAVPLEPMIPPTPPPRGQLPRGFQNGSSTGVRSLLATSDDAPIFSACMSTALSSFEHFHAL